MSHIAQFMGLLVGIYRIVSFFLYALFARGMPLDESHRSPFSFIDPSFWMFIFIFGSNLLRLMDAEYNAWMQKMRFSSHHLDAFLRIMPIEERALSAVMCVSSFA